MISSHSKRSASKARRAAILVLAAFMMIVAFCFAALAIDLGVLALASNQFQNAADAAALAGAAELVPDAQPPFPLKSPLAVGVNMPPVLALNLGLDLSTSLSVLGLNVQVIQPQVLADNSAAAICSARDVAGKNRCLQISSLQSIDGDVQAFYRAETSNPPPLIPMPGIDPLLGALILNSNADTRPNAARVTLRSDATGNSLLPLYFAPMLGVKSVKTHQSAAAMISHGYSAVDGAKILPIAMDITIWRALRLGNGVFNGLPIANELLRQNGAPVVLVDEQRWDASSRTVTRGSDGIWEALLITDPLGNLSIPGLPLGLSTAQQAAATVVTLRITPNQTDLQLQQQVRTGLDSSLLTTSSLMLPFQLPGEKSIPASVLTEIEKTIGQPRVIPLFATLSGTVGNTLNQLLNRPQNYQIVGWGGCVITEVRRTGLLTTLKLQPAPYSSSLMRTKQSGNQAYSDLVFTGPRLVE
jgi:hypothetical protein